MARLAATAGPRGRRQALPAPSVAARGLQSRRNRVLDALTAAMVKVNRGTLPTYDLVYGSLAGKAFADAVLEAGYTEATGGSWPSDAAGLADHGRVLFRDGPDEAVYLLEDGTVAHARLLGTFLTVRVASTSRAQSSGAVSAFQALYPPLYLDRAGEDGVVVPMTFWMLSRFGPERRLRRIDATDWATVAGNYPADVQAEVSRLTDLGFRPGDGGQLILWHGPPGTGKTWALRALASEWASWAEFHYITDPDAFFIQDASYMVDVLLADSYELIDAPTGDLVTAEEPEGKWRILVLEDTGELLSADAKEKSGQGLSRLLNVVDGMIGQGLRILVIVTTNDEIETLHPAVQRPGRCASQLVFGPLSAAEASAWLGETVDEGGTLAELYARRADGAEAFVEARPDDFTPEPEEASDLMASGGDIIAGIREVAARFDPLETGGYGAVYWNAGEGAVFWISADWTTNIDEEDALRGFLAVPGVYHAEACAECAPPGSDTINGDYEPGEGWELVYRPGETNDDGEAALAEALRLARLPLEHLETVPLPADVAAAIADLPAEARGELTAALEQFGRVHASTTDAMTAAVVSAFRGRDDGRQSAQGNELAAAAIAALSQLASRPQPPAAPIHVHVPQQDVTVNVDGPTVEAPRVEVHVPQQPPAPAPVVNVAAAEAPVVNVNVPEQPAAAPVVVNVEPTPVTVNVEQPRPPRAVRVIDEEDGSRTYEAVVDDDE